MVCDNINLTGNNNKLLIQPHYQKIIKSLSKEKLHSKSSNSLMSKIIINNYLNFFILKYHNLIVSQ